MTYVDAYLQSKVIGADGLELIMMLYDRAILSLNIAKDSIMKGMEDPEIVKKKHVESWQKQQRFYLYLKLSILSRQRGWTDC